jgi:signal transduction histidine kinase
MEEPKRIIDQLNIFFQCRKYHLSLWECPQFLFLVMGLIIVAASISAYLIGTSYLNDPLEVTLIVLVLVGALFGLSYIIVQSVERLAEANRMKSEFISIATHQLRSPLANLRWIIEFLISGKIRRDKTKEMEYFKILKENIYRMQESISDLLTVSRIEASKLPIKKRFFSLKRLVSDIIGEYKSFAQAYNVKIILKNQKNLPKLFSDPLQIRMVVENLMDNAVRYEREKGKVEITLSRKGKNIYFSIEDDGVGIPTEEQRYIFQKFFRAKNIREHQTEGSGLGLYISQAIIKRLKGKIGFTSKENIGSTFWFMLPINSNHESRS